MSAPEWISVDKKKPDTGEKVLVMGKYSTGNHWTALARWFPVGTMEISMHYDRPDGWDDETNPRDVWWEESHNCEVSYELTGITHWIQLPKYQEGGAQ